MSPTPPRPTPPPQYPGWDEPAAEETSPPADGVRGMSRRLLAIAGAALITAIVVVVLSSLV
jgi:hypothetical protein